MFAFYFALYTWLDFTLSHFRTSHFIIAPERPKTWGGSSQKFGRIDPGRTDSGKDNDNGTIDIVSAIFPSSSGRKCHPTRPKADRISQIAGIIVSDLTPTNASKRKVFCI